MKSLRIKLLVYILVPTAAIFIGSFAIIENLSSKVLNDYAYTSTNLYSLQNKISIENEVKSSIRFLKDITSTVQILHTQTEKDRVILSSLLESQLKNYAGIFSLWLYFEPNSWDGRDAEFANIEEYDETGNYAVWAYREREDNSVTVSTEAWGVEAYEDDYYAEPFKTGKIYMSEPYEEEITDDFSETMISISLPLYDINGKKIGVSGIDISLDFIKGFADEVSTRSTGYVSISTSDDILIAESKLGKNSEVNGKNSEIDEFNRDIELDTSLPFWKFHIAIPKAVITAIPRRINNMMTTFVFIGILLLSLFILVVSRHISLPLVKLTESFDIISKGDLRQEFSIKTKDETGRLAYGFNQLTDRLSTNLNIVNNSMDRLKNNANNLSDEMVKTRSVFNSIGESIDRVFEKGSDNKRGLEEVKQTVVAIESSIKTLESNISNESVMLLESFAVIEQMVSNINSIAELVSQSTVHHTNLNESSRKGEELLSDVISQITDVLNQSSDLLETNTVISNIASETNLLSMNAAIEAAHAGDAGKGFAVVADEIRKLSESTTNQSKAIEQILQKIVKTIKDISDMSNNAWENFGEIQGLIKTVTGLESEVNLSLQEQSGGSQQILNSLDEMKRSSSQINSESKTISELINKLSSEFISLEKNDNAINISIKTVYNDNNEIKEVINTTVELTESNNKWIESVDQNMSIFKLKQSSV